MMRFDAQQWLHEALVHSGLRQSDLARRPPQKIHKLMSGARTMSAEELRIVIAAITRYPIPGAIADRPLHRLWSRMVAALHGPPSCRGRPDRLVG